MGVLLQVHYQTGSMITSGVHVTAAVLRRLNVIHIHRQKNTLDRKFKAPNSTYIANEGESPVAGHTPR
jgi:hypothetical protein